MEDNNRQFEPSKLRDSIMKTEYWDRYNQITNSDNSFYKFMTNRFTSMSGSELYDIATGILKELVSNEIADNEASLLNDELIVALGSIRDWEPEDTMSM